MSFFRSSTRSRNAHSTRSISELRHRREPLVVVRRLDDDLVGADAAHAVEHPLALAVERALDAQRRKLVGHDAQVPAGAVRPRRRCRYARTSGGVTSSRPGQNGQCSRPIAVAFSKRKSIGRFWRSVDTTTQRPVMGSLRSSGIRQSKAVLQIQASKRSGLSRSPAGAERESDTTSNRHGQSDSRWRSRYSLASCAIRRCFATVTASAAVAEPPARARLHFDEHQHRAVARDDVQFSTADAKAAGNNCVPAALELAAREIFAAFPQRDPRLGHATGADANRRPPRHLTGPPATSRRCTTSASTACRRRRPRAARRARPDPRGSDRPRRSRGGAGPRGGPRSAARSRRPAAAAAAPRPGAG